MASSYDPSKRLEFSKESFAEGVNTLGLPRFTELVTKKAAERQGADFTYQGIKDQFNLPDEQILTLFTNVRDFGKFDQEESFLSPGMQAGLVAMNPSLVVPHWLYLATVFWISTLTTILRRAVQTGML